MSKFSIPNINNVSPAPPIAPVKTPVSKSESPGFDVSTPSSTTRDEAT